MKNLTPAQRLIVAADFMPKHPTGRMWSHGGRMWSHGMVLDLAEKLAGTGVCLKVNADLRATGYVLIDEIHAMGLTCFADLKLNDISATLERDGFFLQEYKPEILTAMCAISTDALSALKRILPATEVLGVTVLTDIPDKEVMRLYDVSTIVEVTKLAKHGLDAGLDGWVCSSHEIAGLRTMSAAMTINTPGIRPTWSLVPGDDQKRVMTPGQAIKEGADRIVVGRPIVQASDPYAAVMRTIEEISAAAENKESG